jgi:glycosyltransferase involved in cell wall biosynthesis
MTISVIIATRDRARLLSQTLDAIVAQPAPGPFELIVVDNASVDDTRSVVDAVARRCSVPVTYLREERPGKSHALNTAVAHAAGDLLVLTDDDVLPSPEWLRAYRRSFEDVSVDYAAGRILPLWEAPPPRWMSPALYGVLAIPDGGEVRVPLGRGINERIMPIGCNMAIRRHVVERIGGWDTALGKLQGTLRTGEDHEFALRMTRAGFRGVYEPTAWVRHRVPAERLRPGYFRRWFSDNGAIVAGLERAYPSTTRYVLGVPRYLWRQMLQTAGRTVKAAIAFDRPRLMAGEMRLRWFAAYVAARWGARAAAPREHGPAPISTGA